MRPQENLMNGRLRSADLEVNFPSLRSLSVKQASSCQSDVVLPARRSSVSEYGPSSPGRVSPTSPYAMSPWNSLRPAASPLKSYDEIFHTEGNQGDSYRCITSMLKRDGHIFSIAMVNGILYTGSDSKSIRVWRYPDFVEYSRFKSGSGTVKALLLAQDKIFSAHNDQKIRVWRRSRSNPGIHRRVGTLPTFKDSVHNFVRTGRHNYFSVKHFDIVSSLAYNATDNLLYSGSWDKTVKVWRMSDFKCIETIKAHSDIVNAVVIGRDGLLFTGSDDRMVKVWRRDISASGSKHTLTLTLGLEFSPIKTLALSADGLVLYAGSSDGYINYWEKEQLSCQMHHAGFLRGHRHAVLCLATAGNLVISGSADTTIRVWVREMNGVHFCSAVLEGHRGPVKCIAASIDDASGCHVYSGGLDGWVKVWWVSIKNKLDTANLHVGHEYFDLYKA
eukprot:Gb_33493 [translate_table: standard]